MVNQQDTFEDRLDRPTYEQLVAKHGKNFGIRGDTKTTLQEAERKEANARIMHENARMVIQDYERHGLEPVRTGSKGMLISRELIEMCKKWVEDGKVVSDRSGRARAQALADNAEWRNASRRR